MASATIPGVYAEALLGLARDRGVTDGVVASCRRLVGALTSDVLRPLDDPRLGRDKAKDILRAAVANEPTEIRDLLALLIDRNRLTNTASILAEAIRQHEAALGLLHIALTVAAPVADDVRERIVASVRAGRGTSADVHVTVDPTLVAGFTARQGDEYVDASLRRQLAEMRQSMLATPLSDALWSADAT